MPRLPENSRTATFRQAATIHLPVLAAIYFWLGTDLAEIGFKESGESEKKLVGCCIIPFPFGVMHTSHPYRFLRLISL